MCLGVCGEQVSSTWLAPGAEEAVTTLVRTPFFKKTPFLFNLNFQYCSHLCSYSFFFRTSFPVLLYPLSGTLLVLCVAGSWR